MPYKDPEKQKAAQAAWYQKNKELTRERTNSNREKKKDIVRQIKESSPCVDCKIYYPYYVMHFDHLDSSQKIANVNTILQTKALQTALDEIAKCDIVCANCHSVRTWKRQHGIEL